MAEHPNVVRHRRGHDAFRNGDMETLAEVIAEDTVWHWPGRSQLGGELRGRDSVFSMFAKIGELTSEMEMVDLDFLASEDRTASSTRATVTRDGETLEYEFCEICRWENGQVVEEWIFVWDLYAYDDFWG